MSLVTICNYHVDPKKVISIWSPEGHPERIMLSVDQGSWSQQFEIEGDEDGGWTAENLALYINEECRK